MSDKTLSYKGYCGSIEASVDDDCLHGKILFITDLVTYEAEKISSLNQAFKEAVDFYLAKCEQDGLSADKPFSGSFNVRVTPEQHREAAMAAAKEDQSLNDFIRECIAQRLSEKTTLVNVTENHAHYHVIDPDKDGYVTEYNEEQITPWQAQQKSPQESESKSKLIHH